MDVFEMITTLFIKISWYYGRKYYEAIPMNYNGCQFQDCTTVDNTKLVKMF